MLFILKLLKNLFWSYLNINIFLNDRLLHTIYIFSSIMFYKRQIACAIVLKEDYRGVLAFTCVN